MLITFSLAHFMRLYRTKFSTEVFPSCAIVLAPNAWLWCNDPKWIIRMEYCINHSFRVWFIQSHAQKASNWHSCSVWPLAMKNRQSNDLRWYTMYSSTRSLIHMDFCERLHQSLAANVEFYVLLDNLKPALFSRRTKSQQSKQALGYFLWVHT